ncbi:MAG: hypothetical protein ACE5FL_10945 [Myxococcota bacterium]
MQIGIRDRKRCLVCGYSEVRSDEVVDRTLVFLAECPRCEHRWTSTQPPGVGATWPMPPRTHKALRLPPEVAPAA